MGTAAELGDGTVSELGLLDTGGILRQAWVAPDRTSSGLGWEHAYLSAQRETPYHSTFDGAPTHLLILHLSGPVTVRRRFGRSIRGRRIPQVARWMSNSREDSTPSTSISATQPSSKRTMAVKRWSSPRNWAAPIP
jgi:hypothetical protein